jgi:hypothetical protein
VTVRELVRAPLAFYRVWRIQRWLLKGAGFHQDLNPRNIIDSGDFDANDWPASAPSFVKRERNPWVVLAVGALALFVLWDRQKRAAVRARLAAEKACGLFDLAEQFLPRRVTVEEFGDAREDIERSARAGAIWSLYWRIATTLWRALWNSVNYRLR